VIGVLVGVALLAGGVYYFVVMPKQRFEVETAFQRTRDENDVFNALGASEKPGGRRGPGPNANYDTL